MVRAVYVDGTDARAFWLLAQRQSKIPTGGAPRSAGGISQPGLLASSAFLFSHSLQ